VVKQPGTPSSSIAVAARCHHHRQKGPLLPPYVIENDRCHRALPLHRHQAHLPPIAAETAEMVWSDQKLLEEWDPWRLNETDDKYNGWIANCRRHALQHWQTPGRGPVAVGCGS
jgi:hypothetical protein